MAQVITFKDDIDGTLSTESVPVETQRFGYKGRVYEIDLSKVNQDLLEDALSTYVAYARDVGPLQTGRDRPVSRSGRPELRGRTGGRLDRPSVLRNRRIRAWAAERGIPMPDKAGSIPRAIRAEYDRQHPDDTE